jgi:hypothetical protein
MAFEPSKVYFSNDSGKQNQRFHLKSLPYYDFYTEILFNGNTDMTTTENQTIFSTVHQFIKSSSGGFASWAPTRAFSPWTHWWVHGGSHCKFGVGGETAETYVPTLLKALPLLFLSSFFF